MAWVRSLAQELVHTVGTAKKKKKKERERENRAFFQEEKAKCRVCARH